MRAYGAWVDDLEASGRHVASAQLEPSSSARSVRVRSGKPVVTDGPFAETKEQLGGYHVVDCADLDEAVEVATRIPTLRAGGTIEVRKLLPEP